MNPNRLNRIELEICVTSLDYALAAERAGADRIELCSDLECGGVTPSTRLMQAAREQLRTPIHVLIRPRPGDFVYSAREFRAMRKSIETAKALKMDGIVLGVLDRNSHVDVARTRELVELAHPLPVTFHRAFDESLNETRGKSNAAHDPLDAVIQTGAERLLTSGGRARAVDALSTLARFVKQAGNRLSVMPGSGITPANILRVVSATATREVHGSMLTPGMRAAVGHKKAGNASASRNSQIERFYRRVLKAVLILRSVAVVRRASK
jgi:copper homeostasis protein